MEADLDRIESGEREWRRVVKSFHDVFAADLAKAETDMKNLKLEPELSERTCDKCGAPMAEKLQQARQVPRLLALPRVQEHDADGRPASEERVGPTDKVCEKCGKPMVIRTGSAGGSSPARAFPTARTRRPSTSRAT
jgi:DNA topoisomerase-1